jgi:hypothetical protein
MRRKARGRDRVYAWAVSERKGSYVLHSGFLPTVHKALLRPLSRCHPVLSTPGLDLSSFFSWIRHQGSWAQHFGWNCISFHVLGFSRHKLQRSVHTYIASSEMGFHLWEAYLAELTVVIWAKETPLWPPVSPDSKELEQGVFPACMLMPDSWMPLFFWIGAVLACPTTLLRKGCTFTFTCHPFGCRF